MLHQAPRWLRRQHLYEGTVARFILSFQPDGPIILNELESKGIYVHISELPRYLNSKITHMPPATVAAILEAIAKRMLYANT